MFEFFRRLFSKESPSRVSFSLNVAGAAQSTPVNYASLAKEGYGNNTTVYRAISLVSRTAGAIHWVLYQKGRNGKTEISEHELLKLINRPNPMQGGAQFFEGLWSSYLLSGNAYVEATKAVKTGPPNELWTLRPDRTKVVPGRIGYPEAYIYEVNGRKITYQVDFVKMKSPILHFKTYNPLDDWYGMAPMQAALLSIDQSNAANRWNLSLLQNQASPSGILTVEATEANPTGTLTQEQFDRLKSDVKERYSGPKNAGTPMLLEGGLKWTQVSLSPKDMDFSGSKNMSARDTASVFGVPPLLLNIPGDNTYSNYKEARLALYEETVVPLTEILKAELNNWLTPAFGENLILEPDYDEVPAIAEKRESKFTSVGNANFLTVNEKREALGYEEKPGWDVFILGSEIISADEDPTEAKEPPTEPDPVEQNPNGPDDSEGDTGEMSFSQALEVKIFNPINRNERRSAWRAQNRLKNGLSSDYEADLKEDFEDMVREITRTVDDIKEPRLVESAVRKVSEKHWERIEKTSRKHIKKTLGTFGDLVFNSASKHLHFPLEKKSRADDLYADFVARYVQTRSARMISQVKDALESDVTDSVRGALADFYEQGDFNLAKRIRDDLITLGEVRSHRIARTEVNMASNTGSLEAVKSLQLPGMKKEWVTAKPQANPRDGGTTGQGEPLPNHVAMDGVRVGLDEKFLVPPDTPMNGPGDASAGPEHLVNCLCGLVYGVSEG